MKKTYFILSAALAGLFMLTVALRPSDLKDGFATGTPEIKSISQLAFGLNGILFIGDSKGATIFAVDTKDTQAVDASAAVEVKNIDQKIASLLGTQVQNVKINDVAVNPVSKKIYVAVTNADGTAVLLKVDGATLVPVSLKDVSFSSTALSTAPAEDAKDQRGNSRRNSAISDMRYSNGKVLVSGISNKEFKSALTSMAFPFTSAAQDMATLEIWHAAHGRFETEAPIQAFTTATIAGKEYLVASYTCTPLVLFPLDELKGGQHIMGRTVAEMGSGNQPLDMIIMKKGADDVLVMANTNRPVFKVKFKDIEAYQGKLTTPIGESYATGGVGFVSLPVMNVVQLDKLDDTKMLLVQRKTNGDLDLFSNDRSL